MKEPNVNRFLFQADQVARERLIGRIRELTPALENSRGKDERACPATPMLTFDLLSLVSCYVPLKELAERTLAEREAACNWAGAVHLAASDNDDVDIPPRPEWLPGRDSAEWDAEESKFKHAFDDCGGYEEANRIYHEEWREPDGPDTVEDPGEEISETAAAILDILETVEDLRYKLRTLLGLDTEGYTRSDTRVAAERSERSSNGNAAAAAVTSDERPDDAERSRSTSTD